MKLMKLVKLMALMYHEEGHPTEYVPRPHEAHDASTPVPLMKNGSLLSLGDIILTPPHIQLVTPMQLTKKGSLRNTIPIDPLTRETMGQPRWRHHLPTFHP